MEAVTARTGARFVLVDGIGPDISSTKVREMAAAGKDISGMVPESVAAYIAEHKLYRQLTIDEMHAKLAEMIPEKRMQHSIGVMETAVRLAKAAGVDAEKARIAGLLHDCAKKLDDRQLLEACEKGGVPLAPGETENRSVLHAPAGVFTARYEFGVTDKEVLSAIRWHTVGAPGMTPLEELIFVADFIEPNRKPIPGLEDIREMAEKDLHAAAKMCAESTKRYVTENGWSFCEQTQAMLDSYND
jgi:nicotinate-nucleotide adenylyltransferase